MGYGVKTDHRIGRDLDLDKTYKNIIEPAVNEVGLECIRADEIIHSGTIDVPMYRYLLSADVVIADLSTYNVNAFYELGVRHALRPYTTIAICENKLKYPFDINHTVIYQYEHLGKDIGYSEVIRFRNKLKSTIEEILENSKPEIDSPVYTYLSQLEPPNWHETLLNRKNSNNNNESLSNIIEKAKNALDNNEFIKAKILFSHAYELDRNNTYVIHKIVLSTYKSKIPTVLESLNEALDFLNTLNPQESTDPETLGLAGAINKRFWEELEDKKYLDKAISYYEKGFYIKNDYYNGINLSYLLNVRGNQLTGNEKIADYVLSNRVRKKVIKICEKLVDSDFDSRSDKYWIMATLEEAYFGLQCKEKYENAKKKAKEYAKENWERETTENQIRKLELLLDNSPLF